MPSFRLVLFLGLAAVFFVATPLLALRATGRWIDAEHWKIVRTGGIAVSAAPLGTAVTVEHNGGKETKETSLLYPTAVFTRLLPGSYRVTASAPGTAPWEKIVSVDEDRTTAFPFTRLFPESPRMLDGRLPRKPVGMAANPSRSLLAAWDQNGLFGIRLRDGKLLSGLGGVIAGDIERVAWMNDETVFVSFRNGASAVVDGVDRERPIVIPLPANAVETHATDDGDLIVRTTDARLLRIRPNAAALTNTVFARDVLAATVHSNGVSYLDARGVVWTVSKSGSERWQRTLAPLSDASADVRLLAAPDGTSLLALDRTRSAWLLGSDADRFTVIAEGVRDAAFSEDGSKILLWGAHEATVFAVRERLDQPMRQKGWRETVIRLSETIRDAAFLPQEAEHLAVLAGNALRIAEIDGRGGRNELLVPGEVAAVAMMEQPERILIGFADGTIGSLEIPSPKLLQRAGPRTP